MFFIDKFEWVLCLNIVGMFCCIICFVVGMMVEDLLDEECGVIVNMVLVVVIDGQMG